MTEKIEFDTHRFVKNLTACGFTEKQAEALADELARLLDRNLATKVDLEKFNTSLKAELEKFNANLKVDMERFKSDVLKWMLGAMSVQTALIAGLILGLVQFA